MAVSSARQHPDLGGEPLLGRSRLLGAAPGAGQPDRECLDQFVGAVDLGGSLRLGGDQQLRRVRFRIGRISGGDGDGQVAPGLIHRPLTKQEHGFQRSTGHRRLR